MRDVAHAAVPALCDWCGVDLVADPRSTEWPPTLTRLGIAHRDQIRRVADGIGSAGTGVRNDDRGARKPKCPLEIERLLLRQIAGHLGQKMGAVVSEQPAQKILAEGHAQ